MATKKDVEKFISELKGKLCIYNVIFMDDRGKNQQSLFDLDITPAKRVETIKDLKVDDYSEGPLEEKMRGMLPMWVFGRVVKEKEVYIKISLGVPSSDVICISFHIAAYPMEYPFKK